MDEGGLGQYLGLVGVIPQGIVEVFGRLMQAVLLAGDPPEKIVGAYGSLRTVCDRPQLSFGGIVIAAVQVSGSQRKLSSRIAAAA